MDVVEIVLSCGVWLDNVCGMGMSYLTRIFRENIFLLFIPSDALCRLEIMLICWTELAGARK